MLHFRDLKVGDKAYVKTLRQGDKVYRAKLLAMGLTPGTEFLVIRKAPLGDPVEIKVRGCDLSLRKSEAEILQIAF